MKYKLLLLDIDGTLRPGSCERVPKENAEAVCAVQKAGVKIAIATGRGRIGVGKSFLLIFFPYFLLSMIVYHGTYFQNWLNASYSPPNKFILFLSWSILFALFVLIFHSIKRSNKTNQLCLLLFILQFFSFFVFFISLSCFAAYLVALVNNIFTLIISVWLMVALWKNGHRASVLLLVPFIVYLLFQLFICFLWYSLAYGEWKN